MKDQLENFVRRNREAFDDREPSANLWSRIEHSLGRGTRRWNNPVAYWRAAAIFFMALSAYLLIPKKVTPSEGALAMKEFSDVEAYYVQEISSKVDLIREFKRNDGLNGFTEDFRQLEAMYQVLKEEMKSRPSEKVKDALVLNLLVRIDLLNQHLQKLEESAKQKPARRPGERKA